jgi:hypothetical protein
MPIVKITGQGIVAIALSVALLWACWIATRITVNRSLTERARVFRDLEITRQRRLGNRIPPKSVYNGVAEQLGCRKTKPYKLPSRSRSPFAPGYAMPSRGSAISLSRS